MPPTSPVWERSLGSGHPGISFFNRGDGTITFDPPVFVTQDVRFRQATFSKFCFA